MDIDLELPVLDISSVGTRHFLAIRIAVINPFWAGEVSQADFQEFANIKESGVADS